MFNQPAAILCKANCKSESKAKRTVVFYSALLSIKKKFGKIEN